MVDLDKIDYTGDVVQLAGGSGDSELHPRIAAVLAKKRIPQHTTDWHQQRQLRITATNISCILYDCPQTAYDVFMKKTGQVIPSPGSEAMRYGIDHEDEAARVYSKMTGIELVNEDIGLVVSDQYPDLAASPDRLLKYHPILVEIKCPFKRKIVSRQVPLYYIPQVQMQLEMCDLDECHFVQYRPPVGERRGVLDVTVIRRDRDWWSSVLPTILRFRDFVREYCLAAGRAPGSLAPDAVHEPKSTYRPFLNTNAKYQYPLPRAPAADSDTEPPPPPEPRFV